MQNTLYTSQASEFSKTRRSPWKGWENLVQLGYLKNNFEYSILDLGCGNGRFLKFIKAFAGVKHYLGIDNSPLLLAQAKKLGGEYLETNIDNTTWDLSGSQYNLIVGFGIQHHLSNFENRLHFLKNIRNSLSDGGIAIVTYWQFLDFDRYKQKIQKLPGENNFSMSFGTNENARFCHYTNLNEIKKLEGDSGLQLIDTYRSDGRDNTENIYRIYSK